MHAQRDTGRFSTRNSASCQILYIKEPRRTTEEVKLERHRSPYCQYISIYYLYPPHINNYMIKLAGEKLEMCFVCRDRNYMCLGVKSLALRLVGSQWAIVG